MSDEITSPARLPSSGVSIGSLYGEVSLRHDRLDRDAAAVKASVAGLAQQLGSLGGVPVASGLVGQFQQVSAVLAPVMASVAALGTLLGGLTLDASGISGGADKASAALERVRAAAAKAPDAIRVPGIGSGSRAGGLTASQRNALAVEQARIGGDAGGRLQVERDRTVAELRDRGASAAQVSSAGLGFDARIGTARASEAERAQAASERSGVADGRRGASGEARIESIDAALQKRIAASDARSGNFGAVPGAQQQKNLADYASALAKINAAAAMLSGGMNSPGAVQAKALAAGALSAGQSASGADFAKGIDERGLQTLSASLDALKAKRDLFLAGWRSNGEDARQFLSDLSGLYGQVNAAAAATPGQADAQARMLEEIGDAARTASEQARALPEAVREAQAALGDAFGESVDRSLEQSQAGSGGGYGYERRHKRPSFSQAMRQNWGVDLERSADSAVSQTAQRGVSGLVGNAFRGISGLFSGGRSSAGADGSATNPFYTLPAAAGGLTLSGGTKSQLATMAGLIPGVGDSATSASSIGAQAAAATVQQTATTAASTAASSAAGQAAVAAGTQAGISALSAAVPWIAGAAVLSNPAAVKAIGDAIAKIYEAVGQMIRDIYQGIGDALKSVAQGIGSLVQGIGQGAGDFLSGAGKGLHSVISAFTGADAPRIQTQNVQSQHNNMMIAMGGAGAAGGKGGSGGLLGGLLGGIGGLLHFASGGFVPSGGAKAPDRGDGDTVPAMLSPGEFVLSKPMLAQLGAARGTGGGVNVTIHQHGDNHFHTEADMDEFSRRQAWGIKNQLQTSAPGMF